MLQNDTHIQALATLQLRYDSVYRLLVLRVSAWNQWKENDIQLNNCIMHPPNESIHSEIPALKAVHEFQDSLSQRRSYFVIVQVHAFFPNYYLPIACQTGRR